MSNSPCISFGYQFVSDGTSTSITINLATDPVFFNIPVGSGDVPVLNGAFSASASSVQNLSISGCTITSSSLLLGILTVNFTPAQTAGQVCTVFGTMVF